ncbi:MAG TPA: hypothetical protein VF304_05545, partial [Casimicrobiaceae bacterium]
MTSDGGPALCGRRFHVRRWAVRLACAAFTLVLASCVSITTKPRALLVRDDGSVAVQTLACPHAIEQMLEAKRSVPREGLDPEAIRLVTWNIHKQSDRGW